MSEASANDGAANGHASANGGAANGHASAHAHDGAPDPASRRPAALTLVPVADEKLSTRDFKSDQEVRWCPGCGDYAILAAFQSFLPELGIAREKEYSTYEFLGNMGTVSLPLTAALAEERDFLRPGDRVGFLGIGSGLNCLMLGVEW